MALSTSPLCRCHRRPPAARKLGVHRTTPCLPLPSAPGTPPSVCGLDCSTVLHVGGSIRHLSFRHGLTPLSTVSSGSVALSQASALPSFSRPSAIPLLPTGHVWGVCHPSVGTCCSHLWLQGVCRNPFETPFSILGGHIPCLPVYAQRLALTRKRELREGR